MNQDVDIRPTIRPNTITFGRRQTIPRNRRPIAMPNSALAPQTDKDAQNPERIEHIKTVVLLTLMVPLIVGCGLVIVLAHL